MEEYENDFVNEDIVDIDINGRLFKYKPTNAGDENDWLNDYMIKEEIKNPQTGEILKVEYKPDFGKLNELKLRNITEVPYSERLIEKIIGIKREYTKLSKLDQWKLFRKLGGDIFNKLITAMSQVDKSNGQSEKKS